MTNYYDREVIAEALWPLRQAATIVDRSCQRNFTLDEIRDAIPGHHAIIAADEPYSREILECADKLLILARDGTGYDKIDLQAATELGIVVTRAPVVADATANLTVGLMIALVRQVLLADCAVRSQRWTDRASLLCPDLTGMTLGIIGFGDIGRRVATRATSLGMNVEVYNRSDVTESARNAGAKAVSLNELLANADVVSIHLPHTPDTRGFCCRELFRKMKKGAYFLNTARGELVREEDLVEALKSSHLAGAALDVFQKEPVDPNNPLLDLPNVLLSPHMCGDTTTTMIQATEINVAQIVDLFSGRKPSPILNPEVWRKARIHAIN